MYIYFINSSEIISSIKSIINSFLPDAKVLLFGSRARGDANNESDYDLLIVTADTFEPRIKMSWENKLRKALVYSLNIPFNVILQSENELNEKKKLTGHIVYHAMKDAVEI